MSTLTVLMIVTLVSGLSSSDGVSAEVSGANGAPSKILKRAEGMSLSSQTLGVPRAQAQVDYLRQMIRQKIKKNQPGRALIAKNDLPSDLLEGPIMDNLNQLAPFQAGALKGESFPWSDTYWPLYAGQISARYADKSFIPDPKSFEKTFQKFSNRSDAVHRENLSPAEKYDLFLGLDSSSPMSLTRKAWETSGQMMKDGKVEPWMGICHGWAPAAYMLPRPKKAVTVMASDGLPLTFYMSDIKALGSLLWATAQTNERFIGGRCNQKQSDLHKMGDSARQKHPECWDTNAGTWHTVVINQIAKNRSFVIDATHDYEVWNQPVQGYELRYFNPMTGRTSSDLRNNIVLYSDFKGQDQLARMRYRTDSAVKYLVGVRMTLTYVAENDPAHRVVADATKVKQYKYDLELDESGKVIGGEWHQDDHPDFMWTPSHEPKSRINNSQGVTTPWNPLTQIVPADWKGAAQAVSMGDQPLSSAVELLFSLSRQ